MIDSHVWLRNIYIDITSMNNEAFIIIGKSSPTLGAAMKELV